MTSCPADSSSPSRLAFFALLAAFAVSITSTTACSSASDAPPAHPDGDTAMPSRDGNAKAPAVGGPATATELTDALGVFVAPAPIGQPKAAGTHDHPLASIQDAIDVAKRIGKRVYVCAGDFHEALTLADSISVIGGLDCGDTSAWLVGTSRTRIQSPTNPAVRALDLSSPTRIEGLEITAPDATTASESSFALVAERASALVIANTKLVAGSGAAGLDGHDGIQLVDSPHTSENASTATACAPNTTCPYSSLSKLYSKLPPSRGGTNACIGASGHAAEPGGDGGSGGIWEPVNDIVAFHFGPYGGNATNVADRGVQRSAAPGANGANGVNAKTIGTFTHAGYVPADGTTGTNGAPGAGGSGGDGRNPEPDYDPNTAGIQGVWRGFGGAGGGAGGCPGLAGTAGTGGGASVAALLADSAVTFDGSELHSKSGGAGGLGSFGSTPTAGGIQGFNVYLTSMNGHPGGRGGAAGISGNGANGPTVGIVVIGVKPIIDAKTKITTGDAAPPIPNRSRTTLDVTQTIPGIDAGLSQPILEL